MSREKAKGSEKAKRKGRKGKERKRREGVEKKGEKKERKEGRKREEIVLESKRRGRGRRVGEAGVGEAGVGGVVDRDDHCAGTASQATSAIAARRASTPASSSSAVTLSIGAIRMMLP